MGCIYMMYLHNQFAPTCLKRRLYATSCSTFNLHGYPLKNLCIRTRGINVEDQNWSAKSDQWFCATCKLISRGGTNQHFYPLYLVSHVFNLMHVLNGAVLQTRSWTHAHANIPGFQNFHVSISSWDLLHQEAICLEISASPWQPWEQRSIRFHYYQRGGSYPVRQIHAHQIYAPDSHVSPVPATILFLFSWSTRRIFARPYISVGFPSHLKVLTPSSRCPHASRFGPPPRGGCLPRLSLSFLNSSGPLVWHPLISWIPIMLSSGKPTCVAPLSAWTLWI